MFASGASRSIIGRQALVRVAAAGGGRAPTRNFAVLPLDDVSSRISRRRHAPGATHAKRFLSQQEKPRKASSKSSNSKGRSGQSSPQNDTVTLTSSRDAIDNLLFRLTHPDGSHFSMNQEEAVLLLEEAKDIFDNLISAVEKGRLNPSGKHGKGISDMMERILRSYRQIKELSSLPEDVCCFELCQEVLDALSMWNLNFRHAHYEHSIAVANTEERWKEAANLFWKQIDPGAGFNPVSVSVSDPQGLIAIARYAQEEQSSVADLVFDAVLQLSMVSPQDQATYVLAAGNALGITGEWNSAVEFLHTSYNASQLGTPLVSCVMQACLLSGKPEEALRVYEEKLRGTGSKSIAREWQWGGDRDELDPLTRDLVMRAAWVQETEASSLALELFHDCIDEGVTISEDAILGVLKACERDRNMEGALAVFDCILDNASRDDWIVPGAELAIEDRSIYAASGRSAGPIASQWLPVLSEHFSSVLRSCNANSSFGTGLFYLRRIDLALQVSSTSSKPTDVGYLKPTVHSLLEILSKMKSEECLVVPAAVSLCGLRCYDDALQLLDHLVANSRIPDSGKFAMVRRYAESEQEKNGPTLVGNSWTSANRHLNRLTSALHMIEGSDDKLTTRDLDQILKGLTAAMESCTNAHHPDLSLRLLGYVSNVVGGRLSDAGVLPEPGAESWSNFAMIHDGLTAEIIHALGWTNQTEDALGLFHQVVEKEGTRLQHWRMTCSAGLCLLVKIGKGDEALNIFRALDASALSPDCYSEIGKHLLRTGDTNELGNLYNLALNSGNLSEDLTMTTMTAVAKSKMDNRVRVLRAMVDDNAKYVGMTRDKWLKTRYWHMKRSLGFFHARLLMWWNDAETCHLDEVELAISEFNVRKKEGLKVKNDVVRVIANNARLFNVNNVPVEFRWSLVPQTKEGWTDLLRKVVEECGSAPISLDPDFIDSVVAAFRNLGANRDCLAFVARLLERDVRLHKGTLSRALEAAKVEQSMQMASDIRLLISDE